MTMKTIDEIAQEHVESVKAYNPTLTWDLVHTAVCYGAQIGAQRAEKELMGRIAYECAIEPTMDGNQVSLLIGDNLQEGVCGFGDTEIDALVALLKDVKEHFAKVGKPVTVPFKVKHAGGIYKVVRLKKAPEDVVFFGIEDEPGHIDYICSAGCEIVEER